MKYIFARLREEDSDKISCILLGRNQTEWFLEDPEAYPKKDGFGELIDWFEVPERWRGASTSEDMREVFQALLALDALGNDPIVTDLFGTIFEAGYQLALRQKS